MKQFNVYGLGNALVDVEYQVNDAFFKEVGVEKGVMTLVDRDQQLKTLEKLDSQYTMVKRCAGGSATNTVFAVQCFGGTGFYSCKVAADESGEFYLNDLESVGVTTNKNVESAGDQITGQCVVMVSDDAERTMNTYLGISEVLTANELDLTAIANSEYLYIEGYLVTSESARQTIEVAKKCAKEHDVKLAFTFSDPAMVQFFKDGLNDIVGDGMDLIFCNEAEALAFFDTADLNVAIAKLKTIAKSFVITLGSKGAMIFDNNEMINIDPVSAKAVDTNGAGDLFAGAYLYGITNGLTAKQSGDLASKSCAYLVENFGARLSADVYKTFL
ncbi:adenosine kinase [Marinicellulosiphila megalodicopiae]|uniref:adenosine kinase n=1 Tax=Marinicellulosiphila megalodicopiae TaxID=2724896 RepID=UPI003BAEC3BE